MKHLLFTFLCISVLQTVRAQKVNTIDSAKIAIIVDSTNRALDHAVVAKDGAFLQKHYADDFVFHHGGGMLDNKQSWINFVTSDKANYKSREHDSISVEVHRNIAIVKGMLTISNPADNQPNTYAIKYYRTYVYRNRNWQLLSHNTYLQWQVEGVSSH
ncbi:MAG: nuclear transport factor 2 family protein [Ginsengibacter sp.]